MKNYVPVILVSLALAGCFTVDKGTATIVPINVAKNGLLCGTRSITAARYMPNGYVISQTNPNSAALKYTAENNEVYSKLEQNIGKPIVIEYKKDWFYINPCIKNQYIITSVK